MKSFFEKNKENLLCFCGIFALLVLQYSWFGCTYWLQLDDYIHYRELAEGTDAVQLCIDNGLFTSRPLVGLLDLVFWGRLPLYFNTVLLCAMYAGAGVLFLTLFRRLFGTGYSFLVIFALLPLGFEGSYWQAAGTRIIPPMLFTAMALLCLDTFFRRKRYWVLVPYILCSLLSFCFYEQMLVLSLALSLMLSGIYLLKGNRHSMWGLTVFVPVAAYAAITSYFAGLADGQLASRMQLVLPWDPAWQTSHLPRLLPQLKDCFFRAGSEILTNGFGRGLEIVFSEGLWLAIVIPAAGVLTVLSLRKSSDKRPEGSSHLAALFATLAILAPITPFFVIANPWVCLRSVLPSFLGLALLGDYLLRLVLKNRTALAAALMTVVFLICSVSELSDYRDVTRENQQIAEAILEADEMYGLAGRVGILDLDRIYTDEQNYLYHDHVMSAHASDWALTGLVRYHAGTPSIAYIPTPLPVNGDQHRYAWSTLQGFTGEYPFIFRYFRESNSMILLSVRQVDADRWELCDESGTVHAAIIRDGEAYGIVELMTESD